MPETVLVVGGGPAGLEAARTVAQLGGRAVLVERRDVLGGTPEDYGRVIRAEMDKWGKIIRDAGIKVQ